MKQILILFGIILFNSFAYSQDIKDPIEVTPLLEKKIAQETEREANLLKAYLTEKGESKLSVEFALDTFRIEKYSGKYMEYDWSTAGMRTATFEAARKYDSLLNKYYKKLLAVLQGSDKQVLLQAQKAWIAFRDSELKLISTISKDEYSGGGTIQQLTDTSEYFTLIMNRTITIYQHLLRATQDN